MGGCLREAGWIQRDIYWIVRSPGNNLFRDARSLKSNRPLSDDEDNCYCLSFPMTAKNDQKTVQH